MEKGRIIPSEAKILVWDKELYVGMTYDALVHSCSQYITKNSSFYDSSGDECACVRVQPAIIYGLPSDIELYLRDSKVYRIIVNMDASKTSIVSDSTGIKLYQEKVIQTAKNLRLIVVDQYGDCDSSDYLFNYRQNGYKFYSSVDREWMHCSIVLEVEE